MYLSGRCRILGGVQPTGERWRLGRRPGLDGVRGLAIGLVLVTHFTLGGIKNGGSVGVTVFFALSGFLITSLLIEERQRTGRVSFRGFYARRARRLLPALIAYLAFWCLAWAFGWSPFYMLPGEVFAALFYVANWAMALGGGMSYPTGITWSLSIEEQFYVLWPLVLLLTRRWPRLQLLLAGAGVVAAVAWRLAMWHGPGSWWPIYYRTEGHVDSLLVGCLLALVVHRWPSVLRRTSPRLGWAGLAVLAAVMLEQGDMIKYLWEPFLAAVASCALIASVLVGGSRWLKLAPLRWLGRRSYALYLWHYPISVLSGPDFRWFPVWVGLVLSLFIAEVSWWLVELPVQRWGSGGASRGRVVRGNARAGQDRLVVGDLV